MNKNNKKRSKEECLNDIRNVVDEAESAFWLTVAESYPEIKRGDMFPNQILAFDKECKYMVSQWIKNNHE